MRILNEGQLSIRIPAGITARKFDGIDHRLSCMKAVDFIIELDSHILFVEFKDPDAHPVGDANWLPKFKSGEIDNDLKYKMRDSWLYEYLEGRINKPVKYLVLIACEKLSAAELMVRNSELRKKLPLFGPTGAKWSSFVEECMIFNLKSWNHAFPMFPITRSD